MLIRRALITGGAGLVGSHIVDQLIDSGVAEIVVLDNFVRGRRENLAAALSQRPITLVDGDIRDRGLLDETMQGVDIVFHQAAIRITQCAEEPRLALEVLVDGTFNVLEAAVKAGSQKISRCIIGFGLRIAEEFPTTESHHPYNNCTLYGAAKSIQRRAAA